MSLLTVVSAKGSPGATALAMALSARLAADRPEKEPAALLVDADPAGGDVVIRLGLDAAPGIGTLALAGRHGFDEELLLAHSQRTPALSRVAVIAGVAGRAQRSAVDWAAGPLAEIASSSSRPVVVDAGRLGSTSSKCPLLQRARLLLLLTGVDTASLVHTRSALSSLRNDGVDAEVVLVDLCSDHPDEIALALGHSVLATISRDGRPPHFAKRAALRGASSRSYTFGGLERLVEAFNGSASRLSCFEGESVKEEPPEGLNEAIAAIASKADKR